LDFFHLPGFDKIFWEKVKAECDKNIRALPKGLIIGSDVSREAIEITKRNLSHLPHYENVELSCKPFQDAEIFENGILITNPPYGIRMGEKLEAEKIFKELGDFIKQKCTGTTAFIYAGDMALRKHIGLKTSKRIHLNNGKLEGVLMQIDSFKGKYNQRKNKG
jgi:putative N6-adenine-specific DNA methylase